MFTTELIEKSSVAAPSYYERRGGTKAVFSVDVAILEGSFPSLSVTVEHKNMDEETFSAAGTFSSITLPGTHEKEVDDLKEQVRLTFNLAAGDWARITVLEPQWSD